MRFVLTFPRQAMRAREMRGTWHLLQLMQEFGVEPDVKIFDLVITRLVESNNLELALQFLALMSDRGLTPLVSSAERVVRTACRLQHPRLAMDLAQSFEASSVRRLGGDVWMDCLIASAETLYVS